MVKKLIGKSGETTSIGIMAFVSMLGLCISAATDTDPTTVPNWAALILAGFVAIQGWRSRDNNKSSEDVDAGKKRLTSGSLPAHMELLLLPLLILPLMGCSPGSMNLQRSGLRASGDLAITLFLDNNPDSKVDAKTHADKAMAFLETGGVFNLPVRQVAGKLGAIIPLKYKDWVTQALAIAVVQANEATVDVNKIGKTNILRLQAFVRGVQTGADLFVTPPVETADPKGGNSATDVGTNMCPHPLLCFPSEVRGPGVVHGRWIACVPGTHRRLDVCGVLI